MSKGFLPHLYRSLTSGTYTVEEKSYHKCGNKPNARLTRSNLSNLRREAANQTCLEAQTSKHSHWPAVARPTTRAIVVPPTCASRTRNTRIGEGKEERRLTGEKAARRWTLDGRWPPRDPVPCCRRCCATPPCCHLAPPPTASSPRPQPSLVRAPGSEPEGKTQGSDPGCGVWGKG
jgi:hypothetical protein